MQGNPVNSTDPLGWFVITGFSTSRIYFKTENRESRNSIAKEFDTTKWKDIIIFGRRNVPGNYSENQIVDAGKHGYGPMCPATVGTSSICQTNMLNKIAQISGRKIFNYTKSGLVPVDDLKVILQPQPTPAFVYDPQKAIDFVLGSQQASDYECSSCGTDCTGFVSRAINYAGLKYDASKWDRNNGCCNKATDSYKAPYALFDYLKSKFPAKEFDNGINPNNVNERYKLAENPELKKWVQENLSYIIPGRTLVFYLDPTNFSVGGKPAYSHVALVVGKLLDNTWGIDTPQIKEHNGPHDGDPVRFMWDTPNINIWRIAYITIQ